MTEIAESIPEDVHLLAGQVVVMLPPFRNVEETGAAIERIGRAILVERERCARLVEAVGSDVDPSLADHLAAAIRSPNQLPGGEKGV